MNRAKDRPVIEKSVKRPEQLTNGVVDGYDNHDGFSYFSWPGYCTVDLGDICELKSIRLLLWDQQGTGSPTPANRKYKYQLLVSEDLELWHVIYETDETGTIGWQVFDFDTPIKSRYIRVHGLWCSANNQIHIVQIEAHDSEHEMPNRPPQTYFKLGARAEKSIKSSSYKATSKMKEIINQLRDIVKNYPAINPEPILTAANELELKLDDINQLEERVEAINRRIVEPVTKELEFGRKAGRFSVFGFWIGLMGIIISIILFALSLLFK